MSRWGFRVCAGCGFDLNESQYSRNQWSYAVGYSRCRECVQEGVARDQNGFDTARTNNCTRISVNLQNIIGSGSFRYCALGTYTGGMRTGQRCVVKYFKESWMADKHVDRDLDAVEKALNIITQWNQSGFSGDDIIRLNVPEPWTVNGKQCLVEPYIDDFFKINSNTGWTTNEDSEQVDMLQALSHYSYHVSSGQFVLCDLQGGIFRDGIILTDPVILSRNSRFGVTDLGPQGISTFFYHHECNDYCRREWTRPRDQHPYYRQSSQTTMSFAH